MIEGNGFLGDRAAPASDRIVLHVDMDCFYAACERLREPALRGEPLVIGMGYDQDDPSGAVATASYEAREFGVESAQPIASALQKLPRRDETSASEDSSDEQPATGYYRPVDMAYYKAISDDVRAILREYAGTFRPVSIDEAYLDVTENTSWEGVESFAAEIRDRIAAEVGVTASIGVAPNMSTAKIASDYDKPDGLVVVPPDEVREWLAPLDIDAIHGVGPVTARTLRERGIMTVGELAAVDPHELESEFGDRGRSLVRRARGVDDREVTPPSKPKSLSREKSLDPTTGMETKRAVVQTLAAAVAERAQSKGARYRTIGIKVVETPFELNTRERSLSGPIDNPELVERIALELLEEFADAELRKLGVRVSNLDFTAGEQIDLVSWVPPDWAIADGDQSRARYGQTRLQEYASQENDSLRE